MNDERLEQLELKADELQAEIRKIRAEIENAKLREEDYRLTQKWRMEGLLPEDWCIHKVVFGGRTFFIICDVPNYRDCHDNISIRFYTPDCFRDENRRDRYIMDILQSIQILQGNKKHK